ncbi:MAG: type II toxin-antitoxin system HigB family toxin [Bacteroidales bacterium]|nr:type II toxin-antitoxin system HigB family toxin [Bacteroidales bacterium]
MRIIARRTIYEYIKNNPQSKVALEEWTEKTEKAEWGQFADIKKTFNSVDYVGNQRYVFNIKGNNYRLVVVVKFTPKLVYIRFIGTHSEYDKITDIKNI